jgi:membrane protein YdbS with pleckstrin-like domain
MASDDLPAEGQGAAPADAMSPLHPDQLWVIRIRGLLTALPLVAAAAIVDLGPLRGTGAPAGWLGGAAALLAVAALAVLPGRRYRAWGWRETEDELHVRSGLWVRYRTVVPFARVQHIDVAQGPVERRFGLATLILHTAGTRGASVPLPGLASAEAERMRDRIRGKIRQELG